MCVGLSYLVKFTYLSSLKNIKADDVTEGIWTNDLVFVLYTDDSLSCPL